MKNILLILLVFFSFVVNAVNINSKPPPDYNTIHAVFTPQNTSVDILFDFNESADILSINSNPKLVYNLPQSISRQDYSWSNIPSKVIIRELLWFNPQISYPLLFSNTSILSNKLYKNLRQSTELNKSLFYTEIGYSMSE